MLGMFGNKKTVHEERAGEGESERCGHRCGKRPDAIEFGRSLAILSRLWHAA